MGVLDEAEHVCNRGNLGIGDLFYEKAFDLLRRQIESFLLNQPGEYLRVLQSSTPRVIIYSMISNFAADHLGSGNYHIYRGRLNDMGPGLALKSLFDQSLDELVRLGAMSTSDAAGWRKELAEDIRGVG